MDCDLTLILLVAPLERNQKSVKSGFRVEIRSVCVPQACKKTTRIGAVRKSCRQAMLINESKLSFAKPA